MGLGVGIFLIAVGAGLLGYSIGLFVEYLFPGLVMPVT